MIEKIKHIAQTIICGTILLGSFSACSYQDATNSIYENESSSAIVETITKETYTTTTESPDVSTVYETSDIITSSTTFITTTTIVLITTVSTPPITTTIAAPVTTTPALTTTVTPIPTTEPPITYAPEIESNGITLISFNSNLKRNEDATITIQGKPNTEYSIKVYYSSGSSTADGLENKISDANGIVSWTWHVGGRTSLGEKNKKIVISGGGDKYTTTFAVID